MAERKRQRRPDYGNSYAGQEAAQEQAGYDGSNAAAKRSTAQAVADAAAKGAVGTIVLISRLMQLASAILMGCMVAVMAQSFWKHGQGLGDIRLVIAEANDSLAVYAGFAGVSLFMGVVWCFWILSRKGAGGGVRMKKYDTGRGFLPFLLCLTVVTGACILLPQVPLVTAAWKGTVDGVRSALMAVEGPHRILLFCSGLGMVLSLVRKILRV